ncbi:MAG: ATP-binding protein [Candidatus Aenigmarchaeota archaeon]|nr:ATP-binding protein [Candidatus Aenigmarchaeota archaeon]
MGRLDGLFGRKKGEAGEPNTAEHAGKEPAATVTEVAPVQHEEKEKSAEKPVEYVNELNLSGFKDAFTKYARETRGEESKAALPEFAWDGESLKIKIKCDDADDTAFLDLAGIYTKYFDFYNYKEPNSLERLYADNGSRGIKLSRKHDNGTAINNLDMMLGTYTGLNFEFGVNKKATSKDLEFLKDVWNRLNLSGSAMSVEDRLKALGVEVFDSDAGWEAIGGYDALKEEVRKTVVLPVRNPDVYGRITEGTRVSAKSIMPKAVLFYGPPGTGKTTMGRVVAGQLDVPFLYVPIESIFTMWYGESPRRLGKIFKLAESYERCTIFIDEIDALASNRDEMHEESVKVMSTLLTRLDGLKTRPGVLTIGATNRYEQLDPAIKRRFDSEVYFGLPDAKDRAAILGLYAKQLAVPDRENLASMTEGYSGSDIERMAKNVERAYAKRVIEDGATGLPDAEMYLDYASGRKNGK